MLPPLQIQTLLILYFNSENHLPVSCGLYVTLDTVTVLILSEMSHIIQTHHHLLYSQRMTLLPTSLWLNSPFSLNCFLHRNFLACSFPSYFIRKISSALINPTNLCTKSLLPLSFHLLQSLRHLWYLLSHLDWVCLVYSQVSMFSLSWAYCFFFTILLLSFYFLRLSFPAPTDHYPTDTTLSELISIGKFS